MNIGHLLRQLPVWWGHAQWPAQAFRKYFLTDSDLLAYYFSSDFDPDRDPSEKHDRQDDLVVVTKNFLTFYRLNTTGLRVSPDGTEAESQSLEKTVVPLSEITTAKVTWRSSGAFTGDAPPEDERGAELTIRFRMEMGTIGSIFQIPMRDADLEHDRELTWHQTETFAEALLLAMEERHETGSTVNLTDPEQ
jgi:hypothetical protein